MTTATGSAALTAGAGAPAPSGGDFLRGDWRQRLAHVVEMMREMSRETDPQAMVRAYSKRVRQLLPVDRFMSLSRRGLERPKFRITRSSQWEKEVNPWRDQANLPVLEGGLFAELIYGEEPRLIDDLNGLFAPDDPAAPYLKGMRSLAAVPHFDRGEALNMVVTMRGEPAGFPPEEFPEWVWLSILFGRATKTLVIAQELKEAYAVVERELKIVADLQRSLLPKRLPKVPGLDLAAHYQTSRWAGGDYYDVFALPDDRWGLLIADVSGHGTPAAVMMAVTHSIAHTYPGDPEEPAALLAFINHHLATRYTSDFETFVTAFYGIYDPVRRTLTYASAGHNPPRLKRCADGSVLALDGVGNLPLGVLDGMSYDQTTLELQPGDQVVFYTDGITEATAPDGRSMFGPERLDEALANCYLDAEGLIQAVLDAVDRFTAGAPAADDRTLLVAKVF
jgi:sigma-B regulation protein RsbU (phosphoserine phosphatase)